MVQAHNTARALSSCRNALKTKKRWHRPGGGASAARHIPRPERNDMKYRLRQYSSPCNQAHIHDNSYRCIWLGSVISSLQRREFLFRAPRQSLLRAQPPPRHTLTRAFQPTSRYIVIRVPDLICLSSTSRDNSARISQTRARSHVVCRHSPYPPRKVLYFLLMSLCCAAVAVTPTSGFKRACRGTTLGTKDIEGE